MKPQLENVRCRFCHKLYERPVADFAKDKECLNNDCLKRRRFIIAGQRHEEEPSQIITVVRQAMHDRSQKPMNSND